MAETPGACSACGAYYAGEGRYCPGCGAPFYITCSHCGKRNVRSVDCCAACRGKLQESVKQADPPPETRDGRPLERRQLTIMFTDLVDSTGLADRMDPEDFRALIEAHRTVAVAPIKRYGGVVARYLGDGMLVLFGYPEAHEDDPDRAVRAGMEVVEATKTMNERWVGEGRGQISVRIGIHTGIVIVGDVLKPDVREIMAVFGNVPSIAARLQALATPNSVVLSGDTKALLRPAVRCETRGNTVLKGLTRPVAIFTAREIRKESGGQRAGGQVLPFVNRVEELETIEQCWTAARKGEGQCVTLEGDPGIGKSRLIRVVEERIVTQPSRWLVAHTSPYATNTDFFLFSELFHHLLRGDTASDDGNDDSFDKLKRTLGEHGLAEPDIAIGFARLLGIDIPEQTTPIPLQPERARELALAAIAAWFLREADKQPLVLVIEDLHWADASSLEAIDRLKQDLGHCPLLLILTTRGAASAAGTSLTGGAVDTTSTGDPTKAMPGDTASVQAVRRETITSPSRVQDNVSAQASPAGAAGTGKVVYLDRLRQADAEDLLGRVLRDVELPKAAVTTLLERANGVPLYLEELPKPVLETSDSTDGTPISLPATLRDSLMAQLDGMGEAKAVAQTAAVLGLSFERPLLEHVWEGDGNSLNVGLHVLIDAALLRPVGRAEAITYGFRHALLAEIAYDSLLRDDRRRIHRKTADILAKHFRPLLETRPELLARHHEAAGDHERAFECWLMAGKAAARRSANAEALGHLGSAKTALECLNVAEIDGLDEKWLALYMARGPVLSALSGSSAVEVEETYLSAQSIFEKSGIQNRDFLNTWRGLYNVYILRGDISRAREAASHIHDVALSLGENGLLFNWHSASGYCDFLTGDFDGARKHVDKAIGVTGDIPPNSSHNVNTAVIIYSFKAWAHWFLGESQNAEAASSHALHAAKHADHPLSMCHALGFASSLAQCQGKVADALSHAEAAADLASEQQFPYWLAWAHIIKGWAMTASSQSDSGIDLLGRGIAEYEGTGAAQMRGYNACLLADAFLRAGCWKKAADTARSAILEANNSGISFFQSEAYRILGEGLAHQRGGLDEANRMFRCALKLSKRQRSLSLHFKASCSLLRHAHSMRLRNAAWKRANATLTRIFAGCPKAEAIALQRQLELATSTTKISLKEKF